MRPPIPSPPSSPSMRSSPSPGSSKKRSAPSSPTRRSTRAWAYRRSSAWATTRRRPMRRSSIASPCSDRSRKRNREGPDRLSRQDFRERRRADVPALLHERPQPVQGLVPLRGDVVEPSPRLGEAAGADLPDPLAPLAPAADDPGVCERLQMLGDRLARDLRAARQPDDRLRAARAQSRDDAQARLVAERGEQRSRADELFRGARAPSRHGGYPARPPWPAPARYFSMSLA